MLAAQYDALRFPIFAPDARYSQFFADDEPLFHDEPLLEHGEDRRVVLVSNGRRLIDDPRRVECPALDLYVVGDEQRGDNRLALGNGLRDAYAFGLDRLRMHPYLLFDDWNLRAARVALRLPAVGGSGGLRVCAQ